MLRSLGRAFEGSTGGPGKTGEDLASPGKADHFGYIYSDWAKDGFDGKQLTVTTYI